MGMCFVIAILLRAIVSRKKYTRVRNEILSDCVTALEH